MADTQTFTDKNKEFWSSAADGMFDKPWIRDGHKQICNHLSENLPWIGIEDGYKPGVDGDNKERKMLDYACGEGFLSRFFLPYFSKCIGLDIAEGMVNKYNKLARADGFAETQMQAIQGNLTDPVVASSLNNDELYNFDLVVVSMALHHIQDPPALVSRLHERLRPGGTLLIIEWGADENAEEKVPAHSHSASHTIAHHGGFDEQTVVGMLENGGFIDAGYALHKETTVAPGGGSMRFCFGRGTK